MSFGRAEFLRIERGQLVLDPSPLLVRTIKFGAEQSSAKEKPLDFQLTKQAADLFQYVRSVEAGEIRTLEIRDGLPFLMEIEHGSELRRGSNG